ncbi:MAG: esterase-like activity of phytase family protein [Limnothrix sp. BL-A-16]
MATTISTFDWNNRPLLGTTATTNPRNPSQTTPGQQIFLGGFSGLAFEGRDANGRLQFLTHTDRGPNGEPTNLLRDVPGSERPFALPNFQPQLIRFSLDPATRAFTLTETIGLKAADNRPITGLPNVQAAASGAAYTDEVPVDLFGNRLTNDPVGIDSEGVVVAPDGSFWMVDEYRPAIYQFDRTGKLLNRFIPQGTAAAQQPAGTFGTEILPAVYGSRRANRGFEAVALDGNKLYAFIQSAIDNPDSTADTTSRGSRNLRIVQLDISTREVTAEYLYILDDITRSGDGRTDKIGDAVAIGGGQFAVIERDDLTDTSSNKLIYQIDLAGATNINSPANLRQLPPGKTIEQLTYAELKAAGIEPVAKRLLVNAAEAGYVNVDKPEGLARVDANTLAIVNDNDFGLAADTLPGNGTVPFETEVTPVRLGLIRFDEALPVAREFRGTNAADRLDVRGGDNQVFGNQGNDSLAGNQGNDTLYGNQGNDLVRGGQDVDVLFGGQGDDQLFGDLGSDSLSGDQGNDTLTGAGLDSLRGAGEIDTLVGGAGSDLFVLGNSSGAFYSNTNNSNPGLGDYALITDFSPTDDRLQLTSGATYVLGTTTVDATALGLFIDNDGTAGLSGGDELIGVLRGRSTAEASAIASRFLLV